MNREGWLSFAVEAKNKKKAIKIVIGAGATFLKEVLSPHSGYTYLYFHHPKLYDKNGNVNHKFYQQCQF